ncbi:MAG: type II toxin-antitoxin system VapC family toxin [Geodermatophilaceae bacterium]
MSQLPPSVVVDASVVVSSLIDGGKLGRWAENLLTVETLHAPHMLPAEVANVLRRALRRGVVDQTVVAQAWADLEDLGLVLYDFLPFRRRAWELRENVSSYDAWYIALAEALDAPLATLDRRLERAPGIRCQILSAECG